MPAVDDWHSCHLHGLGTGQGSGLGGTPRPEEKGRICQNPTLGLCFDKPSAHSIVPVANSSMLPRSSCFYPLECTCLPQLPFDIPP